MQLKKLRLSGFKSFVEPTELRIERGLTGIVGPNGCGKSNLLEAIRWVMGESSPKSMRGGGMEDVIFAGTSSRPARDFAEVTIIADMEGHAPSGVLDPAAKDELEVIRRIERGAGSAYRANGKDVRAKDVALIFADAATGAHSPALVSQGKIAAVIAAKPQERRQMLEEAAGIAGLHVRRKDAEQKLRATETNLARLADILQDMDNRAGALRRQARAAERYTRLTEQIRIAEGRMIFARWRDAAAAADKAKAEAQAAEEAVRKAQESQQAAAAYQAKAVQALATKRAETQKLRDAAGTVAQKLATLTGEHSALVARIADIERQRAQIDGDCAQEDQLCKDAADSIATLDSESKALAAEIMQLDAERPALVERGVTLASEVRDAEIGLAQARATQASEAADRRIAEAAIASAQERARRAERDAAALAEALAALGARAPLEQAVEDTRHNLQIASQAIITAEENLNEAVTTRGRAQAAVEQADAMLAEARAALVTVESESAALVRALAGRDGSNRALDQLRTASGYERALAAALGDELEAGIGSHGTRGWRGASVAPDDPTLPDGMTSLAAHVTAPPELARRLAQIGVADRDEGQPLKVGQRLVTREGSLRRWDGFVTSGDGAMAAERLIRQNRLAALEAELPGLRASVSDAETTREKSAAALAEAGAAIDTARQALSTADNARRTAQRAVDSAEAALTRHQADAEQLDSRRAQTAKEQAEAGAALANAETALAALPPADTAQAAVAALESSTETARASLQAVRQQEADLTRSLGAQRERQATVMAEIKGWRARAGEAARRVEDMAKRARQLAEEAEKLAGKPEALQDNINDLSHERDNFSEQIVAASAAEEEADSAVRQREKSLSLAVETLSAAREERAGAVARADNQEARRIEMGRVSGERFQCPPPLLPAQVGFDDAEVGDPQAESHSHERLSQDRERIGPVNLVAATELSELETEQEKSRIEAEELQQAVNRLRGSIGNLNREGRIRLLEAFEAVNDHFKRLFTTLFNGGAAHLELIDSDDPLEAGLEIYAQPPGKKLAALTLLSGGEQALTAVALIFGLFLTNPAPICVLDEVDAPLDDANIERFCDLLDEMVRHTRTRYLIVTHNAVTMSRMHRLFGVTMVEQGVSRLVSVDLGGAEELLAAE